MTERIAISGTEFPYRPIEELLDLAVELGVRHLELWIPHNFEFKDLAVVERKLSNRNLKAAVISTWTQINLPGDAGPRLELIKQSIQAAKELGARSVNTYFGANPGRTPEEAVRRYCEMISPCVDLAAKEGLFITLENEFEVTGCDVTRDARWVRRIAEAISSPYFRLNFDPCNFYFAGEEPYPYAYRLLKDYIGYVHIKDGTKFDPDWHAHPGEGFLWKDLSGEYICCDLGSGAINYDALLRDLANDSYEGFLGLEPHVAPRILRPTFERSVKYLKARLASIGKGVEQ